MATIYQDVMKAYNAGEEEYCVEKFRSKLDEETWKLCMDIFIGNAIDKGRFCRVRGSQEISEYITVYDEAFALLSLESNIRAWTKEACKGTKEEVNKRRLYVKAGKQKGDEFNKMGWSLRGRERYNEICRELVEQRKTTRSKTLEREYKQQYTNNDKVREKRKRTDEEERWDQERRKICNFKPMSAFD